MLEKDIENKVRDYAKAQGCLFPKITSPSNAGWPDRLVIFPNGHIVWIEFKKPGETPEPLQNRVHAMLREKNHIVYVCDDPGKGKAIIDAELEHDRK